MLLFRFNRLFELKTKIVSKSKKNKKITNQKLTSAEKESNMTYERRRRRSVDLNYVDYSDTYYYDYLSNSAFYSGYEDNVLQNGTISGTNRSQETKVWPNTNTSLRLCGNVPFCEPHAFVSCKDIPIKSCKQCSLVKGSFFLFLLIFLGISIFIGNLLIIAVGYLRYKKRKIDKLDILKVSLAIADLLTGMLSN